MKRAEAMPQGEVARLMTPAEVADLFSVQKHTVRGWFHDGVIPAEVAVGRVYRFDLARVREALAAATERQRARRVPEMCGMV